MRGAEAVDCNIEAAVAVQTDNAEVICLGCAGMAALEEAITTELHVPVVDGVGAAVRLAEAIVGLGLKTSKLSTYAQPEPKKIIGWPLSSALGLRPPPDPGGLLVREQPWRIGVRCAIPKAARVG
jgi:hypothetical protein